MILAWILSEAKPLINVSLSILFHVSLIWILCFLHKSKSLCVEVFQTHGTLKKSINFHNHYESIWLGSYMFLKKFKIPVIMLFLFPSLIFPSISHFSTNSMPVSSRPVNYIIALDRIIDIVEWTLEDKFHLFPPFVIMFHQTIVISPVQNWDFIDSCKVCHVHQLDYLTCRAMEIWLSIWKSPWNFYYISTCSVWEQFWQFWQLVKVFVHVLMLWYYITPHSTRMLICCSVAEVAESY